MSPWERWPKAKILGENLSLTNAEREGLGLWSIAPCDICDEELAEQRKADRARKRRKRAEGGGLSRAAYLAQRANSINKTEPWAALGKAHRTGR